MNEVACPGLPASWLNGWLAAVGAAVLDPRLRLSWTTGDAPVAVLSAESVEPVDALAESWPSRELVDGLPIAARWRNAPRLSGTGPRRREAPRNPGRCRPR